jgi:hypothetical protein
VLLLLKTSQFEKFSAQLAQDVLLPERGFAAL